MKAFVTGAGGFIGSHLVEQLLQSGYRVKAFVHYRGNGDVGWLASLQDSDELEIVFGDVADAFAVRNAVADCDVVFHLAALIGIPYSYVAPESYIRTNVLGTLNMLEAVRENQLTLIHTSTSEVYGSAQAPFINESHPVVGQSPYSASKISADHLVESYVRSFAIEARIVRPFNTYGPRQSARAVIPQIIRQALSARRTGMPISLGSLTPTRDLTFVDDTVRGFLHAAQSCAWPLESLVCNLGTGYSLSIGDLAKKILSIMDLRDIEIVEKNERVRPSQSEVRDLRSDNSRAQKVMDWRPEFHGEEGLEEGLSLTIRWFEDKYGSTEEVLGYSL